MNRRASSATPIHGLAERWSSRAFADRDDEAADLRSLYGRHGWQTPFGPS